MRVNNHLMGLLLAYLEAYLEPNLANEFIHPSNHLLALRFFLCGNMMEGFGFASITEALIT